MTGWLERRLSAPGDDEETRHRKIQLVMATILVTPAGVIWGALYWAFGERGAAVIPTVYSVVLAPLDLLVLFRFRNFEWFRRTQQALWLVLPVSLQLALGGAVGSGLVSVWSFLTVLVALLYGGVRESAWWFGAYVAALAAATWAQPQMVIRNRLPEPLVVSFFVLNIAAVSTTAFFVLRSFVTDRRKLRQLERAYLNQELMLRQSEKLRTLGTLAAGIAHELNNPAAATARAAEQLRDASARLEESAARLRAISLTPAGQETLRSLEHRARERAGAGTVRNLDALGRSDREAAVESWLQEHGVREPWLLAPALVDQGLDPDELSGLSPALQGEALFAALEWVARLFAGYTLLHEIGEASSRISELVGALKSYSYVGQAPAQTVDLREGLDSTLVMMRGKLKDGISVHREYGADVPKVPAYGSELNQVWTNLIDNAADAMNGKGELNIRTRREDGWAVVEIEDNGPGIPEEIAPKIFDPFFTTKPPGKGTGLGLSTTFNIVTQRHKGEIRVASRPGSTRFIVKLPIASPAAARSGGV